jgi:hypothetical protein
MDKLSLNNELAQLDSKNRNFYDELDGTEKKKFSTYLMMKYSANVEGSADFQEWYLRACNERVNKNFFDLGQHPKLQWLLCTSVSPGMGNQRHYWLNSKKSNKTNAKLKKFLLQQYPTYKDDEIELLLTINTEEDLARLAEQLGMSDKEIRQQLKA